MQADPEISLSTIGAKEAASLSELLCSDNVLRQELSISEYDRPNPDEVLDFIEKWCRRTNSRTFAIVKDKMAIGTISLSHVEIDKCEARFGYWISSKERRQGYCARALALLVDIARKSNIKTLRASVPRGNIASRKLLLKFGARLIGDHQNNSEFELIA